MGFQGFEVIQSNPGEISLEIAQLKGDRDFADTLKTRFSAISGIKQVEPDHVRGEVMILYDKQKLTSFSSLLGLKEAFSTLFPEVDTFGLATWLSRYL